MWSEVLAPGTLALLQGRDGDLCCFFQELAHEALHATGKTVLWCDGDHGFDPYDFAELNLVRGYPADDHASRMLVKRCMTPFQWYTTLSRLLPQKVIDCEAALAIVAPFDRQFSTDELSDWEQEDYVRFIVPHLRDVATRTGVPILLGVEMARWWKSHPTLAQATHDGVATRWAIDRPDGRWRAIREDGFVLDPSLRRTVSLLDYLPEEERPLVAAAPPRRRRRKAGLAWKGRKLVQ